MCKSLVLSSHFPHESLKKIATNIYKLLNATVNNTTSIRHESQYISDKQNQMEFSLRDSYSLHLHNNLNSYDRSRHRRGCGDLRASSSLRLYSKCERNVSRSFFIIFFFSCSASAAFFIVFLN